MAGTTRPMVTYTLNGAQVDYTIPFEYLARKFIVVTLVGMGFTKELVLKDDYRFTTSNQITLNKSTWPGEGYELIEIKRYTSATERLVNFSDGSILRAYDLNISQIQSLHIAEEGRGVAEEAMGPSGLQWDARGRRVTNMAQGVNPQDAVNVSQVDEWIAATKTAGRFLAASASVPTMRDDGSLLQGGDRYYNLLSRIDFIWNGSQWIANNLDGASVSSKLGSSLVGHYDATIGAAPITVAKALRETVSVWRHGAIGDGTYHPLTEWCTAGFTYYRGFANLAAIQVEYQHVTSLAQSIDWAACQSAANTGSIVHAPQAKLIITDEIEIPQGGGFIGDGSPMWTGGFSDFIYDVGGTHFMAYGNFTKKNALLHMSECLNSGGVWANPSAAQPHYAAANTPTPTYGLYDFSNKDAVGATPATPKLFSSLFKSRDGGNIVLRDLRLVPEYNGQEGYKSMYNTGLGANCDVGVYLLNSEKSHLQNVQCVGYWRSHGLLKASQSGPLGLSNSERDNFLHCTFQGYIGWSSRGHDIHRAVAVGADYVAIKWYPSHMFGPTGTLRIQAINRAYTSVSYDAGNDWLVFAIANVAGISVGNQVLVPSTNFGTSGTQVAYCTIHDLYHHSRMASNNTAIGYSRPGKCIEVSGEPSRAIQFWGCTIQGRDDIMIQTLHARDMEMFGCYFESQPAFGTVFDGVNFNYPLPAGGRFIAVSESTSAAPYPAGITSNLRMYGCTPGVNATMDTRPNSPCGSPGRFNAVGDVGLFVPREVMDDRFALFMTGTTLEVKAVGPLRLSSGSRVDIGGDGQPEQYLHSMGTSMVIGSGTRTRITTGVPGEVDYTIQYNLDAASISPASAGKNLGAPFAANFFGKSYVVTRYFTASLFDSYGTGSPEGVVTAAPGSTFRRTNGGTNTTFYIKESGTGNTGWRAV